MYSYEDRLKAVQLFIKYNYRAAQVIQELGYPNRHMLVKWWKEYQETGDLQKKRYHPEKYTEEQKEAVLAYYIEHGRSQTDTLRHFGYPGRTTLKQWIKEAEPDRQKHCVSKGAVVRYPQEKKEQAVVDLCARAGSAKEIAEQHGVSRVTLYQWKKQLLGEERPCTMPKKEKETQPAGEVLEELTAKIEELKKQQEELERRNYQLRLENDILEKAAEILKKDPGINLTALTNREKAVLVDALNGKYRLQELLTRLCIPKSSYYYQEKRIHAEDPYADLRAKICDIFHSSNECYGYRRIYTVLRQKGIVLSEKVVRRIMGEEGLEARHPRKRKYSSYVGEVSPAVENVIGRDFHASAPNLKWLTDITEFGISAGKIYLSPIIDCFNGMAVSWTIGTAPNAQLANSMLDTAIESLEKEDHPIVHSDRGGHYRWPGWIERMEKAGLIRSMSKKGCSPDNSACEGFFGRLKVEMFYGRNWQGVSIDEFIETLDQYIHWYNEKRIKLSLGGMSPVEYRQSLGLLPAEG